jgi:hypothetical protein
MMPSNSCFRFCRSLGGVSFCADSPLAGLGYSVFRECERLKSTVIPLSVPGIGLSCFWECSTLEELIFAGDSRLARIENGAFAPCSCLQSVIFPQFIGDVGEYCFYGSACLHTLTFSSPCRIRESLDLPPSWSGFLEIPDSERVEILRFVRSGSHNSTLSFGRESRFAQLAAIVGRGTGSASLVGVSSPSSKVFRSRLGFELFARNNRPFTGYQCS